MQILMLKRLSETESRRAFKLLPVLCIFLFSLLSLTAEELRLDKTGRFRILRSGSGFDAQSVGDVSYAVRSADGIDSLVLADESGYKQCFFDKEMNLIKEQMWSYSSTPPLLVAETFYTYADSENVMRKKQRTITRFDESTQTKTRYNNKGLVAAESVFELNESGQPKKKPISSFMKKYDEQGRVIEEQTADLEHGVLKKTFSYDGKGARPDERRFEKDKEVFVKTYINEKDYQEKVFFDDGTAIVTDYENGVKKKQYVERDGRFVRSIKQ